MYYCLAESTELGMGSAKVLGAKSCLEEWWVCCFIGREGRAVSGSGKISASPRKMLTALLAKSQWQKASAVKSSLQDPPDPPSPWDPPKSCSHVRACSRAA